MFALAKLTDYVPTAEKISAINKVAIGKAFLTADQLRIIFPLANSLLVIKLVGIIDEIWVYRGIINISLACPFYCVGLL